MDYRMISYAANFEDVLLDRAFAGQPSGFYIDVGAYDPVDDSVTKHFYDRGWRGINVEPNPAPFGRLSAGRGRDVNLNMGVSNRDGVLTVYEAPGACWSVDRDVLTGWFGAARDALVERPVPVTTLANLCERHVPDGQTIDFLKIDVEGHEREVIEGGDWRRWRPRVLVVEANRPETWEPVLVEAGYLFAFYDGVNGFFVREEDRRLMPALSVPVNVSDLFQVHGYLRKISELERRLADRDDLGPVALGLARGLRRASRRFPRIAAAVRPLLRLAAG
jgi:FkbM family methyltransferase